MKYLQIYPCEVLGKNTGQFLFPNGSNTTATDGSTFVFRSGRSLVWRFTKYGGDLDSNRKTQGRYSSHWHRFAAFSRNRCFPLFSLGGVLFSSHPPQLIFFLPDFGGIQNNTFQNPWPPIRLFLHEASQRTSTWYCFEFLDNYKRIYGQCLVRKRLERDCFKVKLDRYKAFVHAVVFVLVHYWIDRFCTWHAMWA